MGLVGPSTDGSAATNFDAIGGGGFFVRPVSGAELDVGGTRGDDAADPDMGGSRPPFVPGAGSTGSDGDELMCPREVRGGNGPRGASGAVGG